MKRETLERLLIDRALGHLAPDVEELLQAQIVNDPASAQLSDELAETVRLASELLKTGAPAANPHLPIRTWRRMEMTRRVLALAASFVIGGAAAMCVVRVVAPAREPTTAFVSKTTIDRPETSPSPPVAQAVRRLPFWSYERIYTIASAAKHTGSNNSTP
jgi:hypothetical protein